MNKKTIIIAFISFFIIVLIIRILCSYTIISIPGSSDYGKVFVGGIKHKFPICVVNPLKKKTLEATIINYVEIRLENNIDTTLMDKYELRNNAQFKWWWLDRLKKIPEFKISSIDKDNDTNYLLIESIDSPRYQCLFLFDKDMNQIENVIF